MKNEPKIGQEVTVIRHRHGWNDGAKGRIVNNTNGKYKYLVRSDDGSEYEVKHKRDLA